MNSAASSLWRSLLDTSLLGSLHPGSVAVRSPFFSLVDTCWASWTLWSLGPLSRFCHSCLTPLAYDPALSLGWWSRESGGQVYAVLQLGNWREKQDLSLLSKPHIPCPNVFSEFLSCERCHQARESLVSWQYMSTRARDVSNLIKKCWLPLGQHCAECLSGSYKGRAQQERTRVSSLSLWQKPLRKLVWREGFTVAPASGRFQSDIGWLTMWGLW